LHRPAHGPPAQPEPLGELDLVVQLRALGQLDQLDGLLQALRDLEVEGNGTGPVHRNRVNGQLHRGHTLTYPSVSQFDRTYSIARAGGKLGTAAAGLPPRDGRWGRRR